MNIRLAAHLDTFPLGMSVPQRIARYAELGFTGFEFWGWWQDNYNVDEIAKAAGASNMQVVALCTRFIPLVDIKQHQTYLEGLKETVDVCRRLNCSTIISQVGNELPDKSRTRQKEAIIEGLKQAVDVLRGTGITLVVEPLNTLVNHKGYFLWRSDEAAEIINAVGDSSIKMLFDIYHQQIMEGNIISNIRRYIDIIGHLHCAGVPGRHELQSGELNYPNIFQAIDETGYKGYIGLELFPENDQVDALVNAMNLVS